VGKRRGELKKVKTFILPSEHVFVCGGTGTGKTELVKAYLSKYTNVVILDTKGTFFWDNYIPERESTTIDSFYNLNNVETGKIIYRPNRKELNLNFYEKFFEWCYLRGNTIVCVDEAAQVSQSPLTIPTGYKDILQRGRELNVSVWSLTQRPSGINQLILTESMHYFIFRLNYIEDRLKIAKNAGQDAFKDAPKGHNFYYWRADSEKKPSLNIFNIKKRRVFI
jgi:DNA helicase HerA-like ATPase